MFCYFCQKFENLKWPEFWKNWLKVAIAYCLDTLGVENFYEIALSVTVKEIKSILCFATFVENLKIENGHHF